MSNQIIIKTSTPLITAMEIIKNSILGENVALLLHPRFETEDLKTRQNHTFVLDEDVVEIYDTSRGFGNVLLDTIEAPFPFGCQNASEYYTELFRKALRMEDDISFLGYVDENFKEIFPEDP